MLTNKPWILYGATGRTGALIAEEAVARGHRPVLGATTVARAFGSELTFAAGGELLAAA